MTKTKTRRRKGFTLVELLVVVVIVGILAAAAVTRFADTRAAAAVATLRTDMKNAIAAAEAYYNIQSTYTGFTFTATSPNNSITVDNADETGYSLTGTTAANPSITCTAAVGAPASGGPEGSVACS